MKVLPLLISALTFTSALAIWPFSDNHYQIRERYGLWYSIGKPWTDGPYTIFRLHPSGLERRVKTADIITINEVKEIPKPKNLSPGPWNKTSEIPWSAVESRPWFAELSADQKVSVLNNWLEDQLQGIRLENVEERILLEASCKILANDYLGHSRPLDLEKFVLAFAAQKSAKIDLEKLRLLMKSSVSSLKTRDRRK